MFKATHKRRATTLSKTLLTAGLLGGAALSTLSAGSAQAAWDLHEPLGYICTIMPTMGGAACEKAPAPGATTPTTVARTDPQFPGKTTYPHDKLLTLLDWSGLLPDDTIAFVMQPGVPATGPIWELDLDFSIDRSAPSSGVLSGTLDYKIEITDPDWTFKTAALSTLLTPVQPFPLGDFEVTKSIYSDAAFSNLLLTLTNDEVPSPSGTLVANGSILGQTTIYVRDTWSIPAGSNVIIDGIQNSYTQVPAPLPLLGAGAAFGSIRKLRKFSSQLKTFSMG
jgi:hypothetical protein